MNKSQKIIDNQCKPEYGLKYIHLTQEEMLYITNYNNCNSKTRFSKIKVFISRHKNLKEFEDRIKNCNALDSKYDGPFWYIAHLVSYGRISVNYQVMCQIISRSYKELTYEDSPFINTKFLNHFKRESERLEYCKVLIKEGLRELIIISIFFKIETEQIPNIFNKYIKFCNENSINNKDTISYTYTVLLNMGYTLLEVGNTLNGPFKKQYISKNMSKEFLVGLEEYVKWYSGKVNSKTIKCERSHLMMFFNYIADTFSNIKRLCLIENKHLVSFIELQLTSKNYFGRLNAAGTINNRTEAISRAWNFFIKSNSYKITSNIVTFYDKIKEPKKFAIYISKEEILKLLNALNNTYDGKFLRLKYIIIILLTTGRRIHEVLSLQFNCINTINGKKYIYFHKFKQDKPSRNIIISEKSEIAVLKLQEIAANFRRPLSSKHDNLRVRRLFPSIKYKGRCMLSERTVSQLFDEFQILNGIVNDSEKPIFGIHDIKRTFVSNMLGLGYSAAQVSKFLKQGIDSLLPYESNNKEALKTLKLAEEKGLLIGNGFVNEYDVGEDNNQSKTRIIKLLKNTDVSNRHKENLIYKLKNSKDTIPLLLGECTDKDSILICGTLVCMACDEILLDDINSCEEFLLKIYKYIYMNKRNKEIKDIEQKLKIACEKIYINKEKMSEVGMKKRINSIKKRARKEILLE
jgi:integrase